MFPATPSCSISWPVSSRSIKFDLKFLMRSFALTQAYQRTSSVRAATSTKLEPTLFARMPIRGLTPEQLFDSLVMATGYRVGDSTL